ncbi:MAG: DUF86 domain-containing protein [Promethearchaeota archaeon]
MQRMKEKILELESYLNELRSIIPKTFEEYTGSIKTKRACERLLQISVECVMDILFLMAKEVKTGIPFDEYNLIEELNRKKAVSNEMTSVLKGMRGFRNILVHSYGKINDELVFEYLKRKIDDFKRFEEEVKRFIATKKE